MAKVYRCPEKLGIDEFAEIYRERVIGETINMNDAMEEIDQSNADEGNHWMCNQCDFEFSTSYYVDALAKAKANHFVLTKDE